MRKTVSLTALVLFALLAVAGALQARENRVQPVADNPDLLCGPEVCAQLVPFRTGISRLEAPPVGGS